eukprot:scaffold42103_cov61-Phaeocystis_antarctica.AAC.3
MSRSRRGTEDPGHGLECGVWSTSLAVAEPDDLRHRVQEVGHVVARVGVHTAEDEAAAARRAHEGVGAAPLREVGGKPRGR